jgi:transmembrane sensor
MIRDKGKLIMRYLSNECTESERKEILRLKESDSEFKKEIENLQHIWFAERKSIRVDRKHAWRSIESKAEIKKMTQSENSGLKKGIHLPLFPNFAIPKRALAFATVILMVSIGSYLGIKEMSINPQTEKHIAFQTIKVQNGERYTLHLSDGTKVFLDAGSEIRYPTSFAEKREVYLKGEAFFHVRHDSEHPFYVLAKQARIRVLGTKFNVRAWKEIPSVDVAVQQGCVSLTHKKIDTDTVLITKDKYSSLTEKGQLSKPVTVDIRNYISWMNNEMVFKDARLKVILSQLERWYGFHFTLHDESILNKQLTIHLKRTNVNDVIELISVLTNTRVIRNGKEINLVKN